MREFCRASVFRSAASIGLSAVGNLSKLLPSLLLSGLCVAYGSVLVEAAESGMYRDGFSLSTWTLAQSNSNSFGTVTGQLSFPSDYLPEMTVCAQSMSNYYLLNCVKTAEGQSTFELSVRPGEYFIFSYSNPEGVPTTHYYTGSNESDRPLPVRVAAGRRITNINLENYGLCGHWVNTEPAFCVRPQR